MTVGELVNVIDTEGYDLYVVFHHINDNGEYVKPATLAIIRGGSIFNIPDKYVEKTVKSFRMNGRHDITVRILES